MVIFGNPGIVRLGQRIFPLRGYFALVFLIVAVRVAHPCDQPPLPVGWLLLSLGLGMRWWGVAGWVPTRLAQDRSDRLITGDGPYIYTRNPRYLGNLLMGLAGCSLAGVPQCLPAYGLLWALVHFPIIAFEEDSLRQRYGQPYEQYCAAVPRFWGSLFWPPPTSQSLLWGLAFRLERPTIAGWISLGLLLQTWRWVSLGANPALYVWTLLASALVWLILHKATPPSRAAQAHSNVK